ncbi:unnamed protein product, partial [Medioppia subpectinata]
MLLGNVERAVVCGCNINLEPIVIQCQQEVGACSPRGVSAPMDASADGYVKSDAVCAVLLERRRDARRLYATLRAVRLNANGFKPDGMLRPSGAAQEALMRRAYGDVGVDPSHVTHVELHCAGTQAGDFAEINAVYNAYCKPTARTEPLPLGALKSNMGHAEGAAGLAALIKVLIAYENECIPPNINLHHLRDDLASLMPFVMPVVKAYDYKPGLAAVDSLGVGGANAHVLLEPNYKLAASDGRHRRVADIMPRIVNICGRSEESVKFIMDFIENNPQKITNDFLALLSQTMKYRPNVNSAGMPFRGSIIIKKISDEMNCDIKYEYKRQMAVTRDKALRPLWVLFPGLGGQWPAMARALMPIKTFADTIDVCHQTVSEEFGIDLKHILLSDDTTAIDTMLAKFVATTAVQMALFSVIKILDITVDGIIGHSFGEIACGYADGCLTLREAMIYVALRGVITVQIPEGLMAVVGLSRDQALTYCPNGVYIACNNGERSVVITGPMNEMLETIKQLKADNVFVRQLDSNHIPYHSQYVSELAKNQSTATDKYGLKPGLRSGKWLSTAVFRGEPEDRRLAYSDGRYHHYNMISEVRFYPQLQTLPPNACVLELGPHPLFRQIVAQTLPQSSHISLMKRDSNATNMDTFLAGVAKLYQLGYNPSVERLYQPVVWPVPRGTPSISSLIKWDHNRRYSVRCFGDNYCRSTAGDSTVIVDHMLNQDLFFMDHALDGRPIYPATGHVMLAWRKVAQSVGKLWTDCPVVFEHVQFKRAVFLSQTANTKLVVKYYRPSGEFGIYENDQLCVTGMSYPIINNNTNTTINSTNEHTRQQHQSALIPQHTIAQWLPVLDGRRWPYAIGRADIYKNIGALGLDFGPAFQRLRSFCTDDFRVAYGRCEWTGNPVTYLDGMFAAMMFLSTLRTMIVGHTIRAIRIDPFVLFDSIRAQNRSQQLANVDSNCDLQLDQVIEQDTNSDNAMANREKFNKRFAICSADMPLRYDTRTGQLVSPGLEMEGLTVQPVPYRPETHLVLESYEFCPNNDMVAIDDSMRAEMLQYIERKPEYDLCNDMLNEIQTNDRLFKCVVDMVCENYGNANELCAWEPSVSGLCITPSHLIIMRDSQELWPLDLNTFIQDLYDSIENNGFLLTVFRYKFTEPEIALNSLQTTNAVNNNDLDLRLKAFQSVSVKIGFKIIATKYDTIGSAVLLFRRVDTIHEIPATNNVINITQDYAKWLQILIDNIIKAKESNKICNNVWLMGSDGPINGMIGLINCLRLETGGQILRYIFHYDKNISMPDTVDFNARPYWEILANDLVANVIKGGVVGTYRHLKMPKDYDKCLSNNYYLNTGLTRDISSLQWFNEQNVVTLESDINNTNDTKTRIEIYYSGISTRDIMATTGNLPSLTDPMLTDCQLGLEFSGRRLDTGQRVMGVAPGGRCLATTVSVPITHICPIPGHWSMAEAATIMTAYCTVYYGLIKLANIKKGESVLIHNGSGDVGLAAINVCQHYACNIYVTVGTEEKGRYIRDKHNIPVNRIFSAANDAGLDVWLMAETDGRGVDIALSTGPSGGGQCGSQSLANGGRFVDVGNNDWPIGNAPTMPHREVQYIRLSADSPAKRDTNFMIEFYAWIRDNCRSANGVGGRACVRPLKYTTFPATKVTDAFCGLTGGAHVGKVIIKHRDDDGADTQPISPAHHIVVARKACFCSRKVYIITGGLGGVGLELMAWMHYRGARKFALTSRSGLRTEYQTFVINRMQSYANNADGNYQRPEILISTANGLTSEGCEQLLREAQRMGSIGGVFHLALVLNESLAENMTVERFAESADTKGRVFENLDQLTRRLLDYKVDYFVVFSSISCGKGFAGYSNYAYGNSVCERLCERRRRDGLHGLAVQYGLIGDVGAYEGRQEYESATLCRKQRVHSCFNVLEKLLATEYPIVASQLYDDDRSAILTVNTGTRLMGELWSVLGVDPCNTPDDITIGEIGIESLFAIRMQNEFTDRLALNVSLTHIKHMTVGMCKAYAEGNPEPIRQCIAKQKAI